MTMIPIHLISIVFITTIPISHKQQDSPFPWVECLPLFTFSVASTSDWVEFSDMFSPSSTKLCNLGLAQPIDTAQMCVTRKLNFPPCNQFRTIAVEKISLFYSPVVWYYDRYGSYQSAYILKYFQFYENNCFVHKIFCNFMGNKLA